MSLHQDRRSFERLALLTESAPELGAKLQAWHDFYKPSSPGEAAQMEMSVMSLVQRRRVHECQTEILNQQIRTAVYQFDCAQEDEVQRCRGMFPTQPGAALVGLKRSALGLRFLIQRWERLLDILRKENRWCGNDRDEAINYLGARAGTPENLFASEGAYLTWIYCVMNQPDAPPRDISVLGQEHVMPRAIRDRKPEHWLPRRDLCLQLLKEMAERALADLRPREVYLRVTFEEPARDAAEITKQVLAGPDGALLLRHLRTHESHFHRAYGAFLKGRKETIGTGLLPGQPQPELHGTSGAATTTDEPGLEAAAVLVEQARAARKQGASTIAPGGKNAIGAPIASGDTERAAVVATGVTREQIEAEARAEAAESARLAAAAPPVGDTKPVPEAGPFFPGVAQGSLG